MKKPVKLVEIPEEALEALLKEKNKDSEEFLQEQKESLEAGQHFKKRAKAAYWSKLWLITSAAFSGIGFAFDKDFEDGLSVVLLLGMTWVEGKVYHWFLEGDERAAHYGFWNQTLFCVLFLVYGGYHYLTVTIPPEVTQAVGDGLDHIFLTASKATYATIGIVGGGCQFLLALHYKRALLPPKQKPRS
jgi:hypothetical protein